MPNAAYISFVLVLLIFRHFESCTHSYLLPELEPNLHKLLDYIVHIVPRISPLLVAF